MIGTSTESRGRREVEGLIGCFVNLLPVRVDLSGSPTAAELLAGRVEAQVQGALRNEDLPFQRWWSSCSRTAPLLRPRRCSGRPSRGGTHRGPPLAWARASWDVFAIELPLRALFESPTVAGLAPQVETLVLAQVEESELADALEQLEGLSDDKVMQLLGVD